MLYITGYCAFGVTCELDSTGVWDMHRLDWEHRIEKESEGSTLGDYGIEKDKLTQFDNDTLYNIANHVRAYCDMLEDGQFNKLHNLFDLAIRSPKCRAMIFQLVYEHMNKCDNYDAILKFMQNEFGNNWESFVNSKLISYSVAGSAEAAKCKYISQVLDYKLTSDDVHIIKSKYPEFYFNPAIYELDSDKKKDIRDTITNSRLANK